MASSGGLDERAKIGFAKSSAYDQNRPTYSSSIVQLVLEKLKVAGKHNAKILDLAAGTGKFTEALAARDEQFEIVAVEPHDDMRQVLDDKKLPGVTVKAGKADGIPLPDESVDAVICAQSFHWFANMESLYEIHRVLQPHSSLGMVWNIDDYNTPEKFKPETQWETKLHQLTWTFDDDLPRFRHERWRTVFDEQVKKTPMSLFTAGDQLFTLPLGEHDEKFEVRLSKDKIWERYNTLSHIARLEGKERERTYKTFMDAINAPDVEVDGDGNVAMHGTTFVTWTEQIPSEGREKLTDVNVAA